MKILIVKMSALGDIIHALPVLDYLHQAVPKVQVDWVVEEQFRDILEGNQLIDRLHVVRTKAWRKAPLSPATWREAGAVKEALRERAYDMVFDIQGNLKSGIVTWLSGCEQRIGIDEEWLQERVNAWFTTRRIPLRREDRHVSEHCLRIVSVPFGRDFRSFDVRTDIFTTPEDDAAAVEALSRLSDGLVFLFHAGTMWETKLWTVEGWVRLGTLVRDRYPDANILLSWGSETERVRAEEIAAGIGAGAVVLERYPLKRFTALLKKVDMVIGGDTGPVHLAAAAGTPTVSFYRASDGARSGPRGACHIIVQTRLTCSPCFRTRCDADARCRDSIEPAAVFDAVASLLA